MPYARASKERSPKPFATPRSAGPRSLGLPKTALGHVFTVTAINLIRLDAWWTGIPRGSTRVSHLTRLATDPGLAG